MELSYISRKVYSEPWHIQNQKHIQNPGIFRTRGIFRTMSNICDGAFSKNSYLAHFLSPNLKNKRNLLLFFPIFWKVKLSSTNIKKFLVFSQNKALLIFQEKKTSKKIFIFQEVELSYISGNFLYFNGELPGSKKEKNSLCKNVLYFGKLNFLASRLKNFLYFKKELANLENHTIN